MDKRKKKRLADYDADLKREREQQAAYRRKLLKSLSPKAREYARQEFAKLGLTQ